MRSSRTRQLKWITGTGRLVIKTYFVYMSVFLTCCFNDMIPGVHAEEANRLNVLFVVIDDLRPALGCYGDKIAVTPNIDRLANCGMVFNRAYCQQAVCSPSRLSFMTGRRPDTIRVWDLNTHFRTTSPDIVTLPQHFKNHGYHTQSLGKVYHGGGKPSKDPLSWTVEPLFDVVRNPKVRYASPQNFQSKGFKQSATEAADVADNVYIDGIVCDAAVETLTELKAKKRPFFLTVGFRKPHLPFCAPQKYWDLYDRAKIPLPTNDKYPKDAPELATRSWKELEGYTDIPMDGQLSTDKVLELRHGYYACVSYVDTLVGRLLDQLKRLNLTKNTVVVLCGDHGYHLGEQGLWTKANNYELSTRVPLIVSVPVRAHTGSSNALVELIDVYPTLAGICGLNAPQGVEGTSFKPLLTKPDRPWKHAAFSQYPRAHSGSRHRKHGEIMGYAVRTRRYRYVEWREWESKEVVARELYDHESDPHEMRNIVTQFPHAETLQELAGMLDKPKEPVGTILDSKSSAAANRPNVLFLAVDDMKDWVNCLGGYEGTVYTPNIDRLAKRGMLFTNAHCASPLCAPSRTAIMTGLRPSTTGLYGNKHWWLPNLPDVVTIPAHFRNHGYQVIGAGKVFHHTAGNHPPNQWDAFFRLTFGEDPWFRGVKLNYPWSKHTPYPNGFPFSGVKGLGHENDWGSLDISDAEYDDALTVDYAIRFLKQKHRRNNLSGSAPFLLACGLFRPHLPWYVPQRFFDRYSLDDIVLPKVHHDDLDDLPAEGLEFAKRGRSNFESIKKAGQWKHAVRAYLASITCADERLGHVLDALDKSPYAKNTIIVLWSDHGWHLGEKRHWHKSTLWEEATRVPLVISAPNYQPGVCDQPVSLLDLYPTLNELADLKAIENFDGVSLTPLLRNPKAEWKRPAVTEFKRGNAAVRSSRYRYIRYHDGGEELYDHKTDPHEWHNLATSKEHYTIKQELAIWITKEWAKSAPTKGEFRFDPDTFKWTHKRTGKITHGK